MRILERDAGSSESPSSFLLLSKVSAASSAQDVADFVTAHGFPVGRDQVFTELASLGTRLWSPARRAVQLPSVQAAQDASRALHGAWMGTRVVSARVAAEEEVAEVGAGLGLLDGASRALRLVASRGRWMVVYNLHHRVVARDVARMFRDYDLDYRDVAMLNKFAKSVHVAGLPRHRKSSFEGEAPSTRSLLAWRLNDKGRSNHAKAAIVRFRTADEALRALREEQGVRRVYGIEAGMRIIP
ncbi:unnamed protein product [Pedinophyceae sp. YPF-701]|nr:unnamed protein product [Pedinophyceae sp. YPF-701]